METTMILQENKTKSIELQNIFKDLISKYEMSFAVVDLNSDKPEIFGYNLDHFIYPASMYKVFIGAEVLRRIEVGDFNINQKIAVKSPNDVDKDARIFPGDTRKLLNAGDLVAIDYLLDLMLTRSDNTASNCLIDLVGRESITQNIIYKNGWQGSEVTRKFLDRIKEDKPYQFSSTTMSCARHFAEFFYLVENGKLESEFVSRKLKDYMLRWSKEGRKGLSLKEYALYYRKGGYLENNLYLPLYPEYYHKNGFAFDMAVRGIFALVKNIIKKGWAFIRWSNDAGVVVGKKSHYVAVIMTVSKVLNPKKMFPTEDFAKRLYNYMEK
ncbi:MAG: beta-lactamase [Patescibacteria group bacterium]|nr:beta-lactamase [Patescibacteria group bacterium]